VPEFRGRGLADEDRAGFTQPAHGHRVLGRHLVGKDQRAHRGADALGEQQVLDRERHPVEGAEVSARHHRRLGPARGFPGLVRGHGDEGVDGRLERLDPPENGVDQRDG
jgi:hypothetical protein